MAGYESLKAWQVTHRLNMAVRRVTKSFPKEERFELTSQLRRAALSAPTNLVEGRAYFGRGQYLQHARVAFASLAEVDYLLGVAHEDGYLADDELTALRTVRREATFLVLQLIKRLEDGRR